MNHLLRSLAPISDAGWELLDEEARERLTPALAARKLVDFSGPHGWEHSATNLGRTAALQRRRAKGCRRCSGGSCRWSSCAPTSSFARRAARRRSRRRRHRPRSRSTRPRTRSPWPRTSPCSTAGRARSPGSARPRRTSRSARRHRRAYPRHVAGAVEQLLGSGIAGPYGLALGREHYRRVIETAEHGGYPLLEHLRKILDGPIVWAPGRQRAPSWSACAAATSCSSPARTSRSATTRTTATSCACTSRRASASTSPRPRPPWR